MLIRFLSMFIIFSVCGGSFFEAENSVSEYLQIVESISHNVDNSEDRSEDDCHDGENCCDQYCLCTLSLFVSSKSELLINQTPIITKQQWYLYVKYRSPFLHPALKPPLFS